MSHRFQLRHMGETSTFCRIRGLQWMGVRNHMSHRFQLKHMGETSTFCRIFGLQWMGAWNHMNHRFQLRHICEHRQFADSLACNAWARGSRSGKFPAARSGHRDPLSKENWRHTSVTAPARGTAWSRQASCRRPRAAPFGHEVSNPNT